MHLRLIPHPASTAPALTVVTAVARGRGTLDFRWRVTGAVRLKLPAPGAAARTDGLWRTTCFEAFLRPDAGAAYFEFNVSPSSQWAAYRFPDYRRGMTNAEIAAPAISVARTGRTLEVSASFDLGAFLISPSARLGLAAVIETMDGAKSYWALAHTGDKPDFHRADAFIARLPFESRV
ncbi:MAG TPA: hypothetical protein DEA40_10525 [Parvularcula sp.]|nr:hypothetical protein [Parvularcula sp.]